MLKNNITSIFESLKEKPISRGRGQRRKIEICLQTIGHLNDRPEIDPATGQFDNTPDENEGPKEEAENEIELWHVVCLNNLLYNQLESYL